MKEVEIRVIKLFDVLRNPTRYKIVKALNKKELSVTEIQKIVNKTKSSVSHHLNLLKKIDIVRYHMDGKEMYYKLKKKKILSFVNQVEKYYLRIIKDEKK